MGQIVIHKPPQKIVPISVILIDWNCRDRYCALETLSQQTVPRNQYELLWIDYFSKVPERAIALADKVITMNEQPTDQIAKQKAYNTGLLFASGQIICIPDSDAWFPHDFIGRIMEAFLFVSGEEPLAKVVFVHEYRTETDYPGKVENIRQYAWEEFKTNYGACVVFPSRLAIAIGGYDEHEQMVNGACGPYELAWRLINFGIQEEWVNIEKAVIYHFNHPGSNAGGNNNPSIKAGHGALAVESLQGGRLLPLVENVGIKHRRLSSRRMETTLRNIL